MSERLQPGQRVLVLPDWVKNEPFCGFIESVDETYGTYAISPELETWKLASCWLYRKVIPITDSTTEDGIQMLIKVYRGVHEREEL